MMSARRRTRALPVPARWLGFGLFAIALAGGIWFFLRPASTRKELRTLMFSAWSPGSRVRANEVVADLWDAYLVPDPPLRAPAIESETAVLGGWPQPSGFRHGSITLLQNQAYAAGWVDRLRCSAWVAYRVGGIAPRLRSPPRPDRFVVDRRLSTPVKPDDYLRTGYDRGHLAPNLAIGRWFGPEAQRETFLMSNVVPQAPELNGGLWRELESRIAYSYPARLEQVWVLCGPLFDAEPRRLAQSGVALPSGFYLIVVDVSNGRIRALALILPQERSKDATLETALTSIDAIELQSGLDFLPQLEDQDEQAIESRRSYRVW
jgi:endonuclease G